ncbi:MAG: hypothetical protein JWQ38_580 [Flavipsychrobacter sp.]|nr:hypothetical protein [Flavipsychrobacter sp.]
MCLLVLAVIMLCVIPYVPYAQSFKLSPDIRFNNYTAANNFARVFTRCVYRSSKGYVWVGGSGLFRFDGKRYTQYNSFNDDHHQFKVSYITDILEDRFGRIWVSGNYLSYFDEKQDMFRYIDIDTGRRSLVAYGLCINKDKLWFTSDNGLNYMDLVTLKPHAVPIKSNADYYMNYVVDSNNIIHGGYSNHYYVYHIDKNTYDSVIISKEKKIFISSVVKDHGKLWFSTTAGLWCTNDVMQAPRQIKNTEKLGLSRMLAAPAITGDSLLLLGTETNGILVFDRKQEKIAYAYTHVDNDPYSLPDNGIGDLYVDRNNILWVCTDNGLCSVDPGGQYFKEKLLPNQYPIKIVQDAYDSSVAWLSIYQKGIMKMDWVRKKEMAFSPLNKIAAHDELGPGIYDMLQIDRYRWLVLGQPALAIWNSRTGTEKIIDKFPLTKDHRSLYMRYIIPYNKDTCFVTGNNGLFLFHIPSMKVDTAIVRRDFVAHDCNLMTGVSDNMGGLWIASRNGLVKYNVATGKRKMYYANSKIDNANFLSDVACGNGHVYMVGAGGIGILDTVAGQVRFFDKFDNKRVWGAGVSIIDSIAWINTTAGIVSLNTNRMTATIHTPSSEGDNSSSLPFGRINNELVWLSRNRYIYFNPAVENRKPIPEQAIIEKVTINNSSLYYPGPILSNTLRYNENTINFYFTAFEFIDPNGIQFRYKLEGLDKDWAYTTGQREANYIHIPPGKYTFIVQAGNASGKWDVKQASFSFEIVPPYWQTAWFAILVVVVFMGVVIGTARWRIKNIRNMETQKTAANKMMAELEMKALRSQMNPHFIFNSLNSIQKFIWENKQEDASEYLIKFSRLMRQILDNSMHKLITLEQELTTLSLYIELEHRRSNNKFDYRIIVGDKIDTAHILVPSLILQPYVENAIWHGLLHKEDRGELKVSILHIREQEEIQYIIEDNGIGRKRSMELREKKGASYGMQITEQRLAMAEQGGRQARIVAEDLYDENGNATGTRITINIPITDFITI